VPVGSQQYTVTTAAVAIASAPAGPTAGPAGALLAANTTGSAVTVYLGGPNVSSSNGFPLAQNASISTYLFGGDTVYAITASGSATLAVLQT